MKETIHAFSNDPKVAIVGASTKKDNFGRSMMAELIKLGYEVFPVNPGCDVVEGNRCVPTVKELPNEVVNVILAVPPTVTEQIVEQCIGTHVKRVLMIKGMGRGAFSEGARSRCHENGIEVVYGLCPMMFFGTGAHRFHFWLRKNFGKLPKEYLITEN